MKAKTALALKPGQTVGVLGLGEAGRATVSFLLQKGLHPRVSEQRTAAQIEQDSPGFPDFLARHEVAVEFGGNSASFLDRLDLLVPAPGVSLKNPLVLMAKERGIPVAGELALAAGRFGAPVIAITGSNGKTTVTSLIGHLLLSAGRKPFIGGNIGTPLLDYFSAPPDYDCVVLELSSFQLELSGAFRPEVGILLNITPDHLDRHGSLAVYAEAKRRLFANQVKGDTAILGVDDALAAETCLKKGIKRLAFGAKGRLACRMEKKGLKVQLNGGSSFFDLEKTPLASPVNRLNAAAAILAVKLFNCGDAAIEQGLASFAPPPHRMAKVAEIGGVTYINDSKATNIGAMAAALAACPGKVVLIAGGRDKGGDYGLVEDVVRAKARCLVLLGEAAPLIEKAYGQAVAVKRAQDMAEAVFWAKNTAQAGDTVLLAPGCSSFDMFKSYAERGEVFTAAVRALAKR